MIPYVLRQQEVNVEITRLDAAWNDHTTFAFVPEKSGTPNRWIEEKLAALPCEYTKDHFVLLTSGSTGQPKLVVGHRDRAERLATVIHKLQENEPVREAIVALPLTYSYAFVNQWLWARHHKRKLLITRGLSQAESLRRSLLGSKDGMICLVGAQVPLLLQHCGGTSYPGIIRVHFAGGRFPQERLADLRRLFPRAAVFNNYGCAEALPRLTLRAADAAIDPRHIGWPLPGIEMRADDSGRMLFRSPYGAVGLVDHAGFVKLDSTTWIPTGDLGRRMEDGHWEIMGRESEVFKRYGEKISVPQVLATISAVWGGLVEYYIETDPAGETGYVLVISPRPTEDEARAVLKRLGASNRRAHWPLRIESQSVIPLLQNGKTDRRALASSGTAVVHWKQYL